MGWVDELRLLLTALAAAGGVMAGLVFWSRRAGGDTISIFADQNAGTVFLFDGETLVDSTPGGRALLAASQAKGTAWHKLVSHLGPLFHDLSAQLMRLQSEGMLTLASDADSGAPILMQVELRGGLTRIALTDPSQADRAPGIDPIAQRAQQEELDLLRLTVAKAPVLIWRENDASEVVWANAAYLGRASDQLESGKDLTWPLPRLFEKTAINQAVAGQRQKLGLPQGKSAWYDLVSTPEGKGRLIYALPSDSAVQAETALRDFMQTLTKTFAHLHVGLAIFDHQRMLQLFNPALLDLTGLPVDFLSMRPSLVAVLDAMRDRNMIPEPKDYRGWRRQLIEMERAASSGLYEETWSLPGGQTYRVIGRPHPNGAIALMIEDISGEMLRTRRYRADLELGQSVIDEVDEAIAVFSQPGHLVMTNAAYGRLWGNDPSFSLIDAGIRTVSAEWGAQCAPNLIWSQVEAFVANHDDRKPWVAEARLLDGRLLQCRFVPLNGGATMAAFRLGDVSGGVKALVNEDSARKSA